MEEPTIPFCSLGSQQPRDEKRGSTRMMPRQPSQLQESCVKRWIQWAEAEEPVNVTNHEHTKPGGVGAPSLTARAPVNSAIHGNHVRRGAETPHTS